MWRLQFKGGAYGSAQHNPCCTKIKLNINYPNYFDPYLPMKARMADRIDLNNTYRILSSSCKKIFLRMKSSELTR